MNPTLTNIAEDHDVLKFTLSNINVSLANGLRRTILSSIDTVVFRTETYSDNQCTIYENTGRLHNEIVKQRLSSIPIHSTNLETLPGHYLLELNIANDSDTMRIVTTEDFRIKNKESGGYLTEAETRKTLKNYPDTLLDSMITMSATFCIVAYSFFTFQVSPDSSLSNLKIHLLDLKLSGK
jgi:DNA-directed RNA polymerase alpha subunit